MDTDTLYTANRLIYLSLIHSSGSRRAAAQHSAEMTELVQRFQAEDAFRSAVDAGLRAMELRLLALEEGGLRLAARNADGFFAATLTDYGRLLLVGDAPYYGRFGYVRLDRVEMPPPTNPERVLGVGKWAGITGKVTRWAR